jgi:hypothetical protein
MMNERIIEMAREAGGVRVLDAMVFDRDEYLERFAELIIQECVDILKRPDFIMKLSQTELSDYNQGWINGRLLAIERIEEHFGNENE